jgi:predicted RNA-binding protein with PIN domain
MRWLIDGYNVMHADGRLGPKLGPRLGREGFRRARRRFLDDLSAALGPVVARETTVVFDATFPPSDFQTISTYRGLDVVFALGDENADARIEQLIAEHANPKTMTVISSDRRIRLAATRRHTRSVTSEQYWVLIDRLKERGNRPELKSHASRPDDPETKPTPEESAFWVEIFGELEKDLQTGAALMANRPLLTDAEIADLQREIEQEP